MIKFRDLSFSNQLAVFAISLTTLITVGLSVLIIMQTRNLLRDEKIKQLEQRTYNQTQKINSLLQEFEKSADFFAESELIPIFINLTKNPDQGDLELQKRIFSGYSKRYTSNFNIENITLFDDNGPHIFSLKGGLSLIDKKITEDEYCYGIPYKEGDSFFLNAYKKVNYSETSAIIGFKINLADIYASISDTTKLGTTGETLLGITTENGALFINPLRFDKNAAFARKAEVGSKNSIPMLEASKGIVGKGITSDYRNKEVIAVWTNISKVNWGIVAKIDTDEVYEPLVDLEIKILIIALVFTALSIGLSVTISRITVGPINKLKEILTQLSQGNTVKDISLKINKDEIGQMLQASMDLADFQNNIIEFSKNISESNFEKNHSIDINRGQIGEALLSMGENLEKVDKEDKIRTWYNEGIAKFANIIRDLSNNTEELSSKLINELIRYLNANQGGIFILRKEEKKLEQISFYAFDRQKFAEQTISDGDGLLWQAVYEKQKIVLTQLPENYIKVTSGLGEALPRALMIVPLVFNEEVYGVIEIASFTKFKDYEVEFVEKLSESIAGAISNLEVNEKTRKLLEMSQAKTQELSTQEEEMRQNLEEMTATQEEMQRIQNDVLAKEAMLRALVDNNEDTYFCMDTNYNILVANKALKDRYRKDGIEIKEGTQVFQYFPEGQREIWKEKYERILRGEHFTDSIERKLGDNSIYVDAIYTPIKDEKGNIVGASVLSRDVTSRVILEKRIEELEKKING